MGGFGACHYRGNLSFLLPRPTFDSLRAATKIQSGETMTSISAGPRSPGDQLHALPSELSRHTCHTQTNLIGSFFFFKFHFPCPPLPPTADVHFQFSLHKSHFNNDGKQNQRTSDASISIEGSSKKFYKHSLCCFYQWLQSLRP